MAILDRIKNAYNAFRNNKDPTFYGYDTGTSYFYRPDRRRFTNGNERSIVTAIFNKIAMDAATIDIEHVRLDDNGRYIETIKSTLNECLSVEANIDQTGRALRQDIFMSMFDEGCVAVVPIDTSKDPKLTDSYDIYTMRTGKIMQWKPQTIQARVYNDITGQREDVWIHKKNAAIIENPLYAVMNEKSSTMQRLIRKLNILDAIDEQSGSGKLDLIVQLPYTVKSTTRREQAEQRRQDIENQLSGSKFGIAYIDATEHVTQLNRPVENNLMKQIEYLTSMLFSQLGITQSILDGTADEKTMLNYYSRTVEPVVSAVVDEMKRKFLTKTARSQGHSICAYRDPFKLVPVAELAKIADTLTRNEIATSNEIRQMIGWKPSNDPKADQLVNSNISQPSENAPPDDSGYSEEDPNYYEEQSGV
jgi:hypothetical protein